MLADSREVSNRELKQLLAGDWREALTAFWLIGFAQRSEFRAQIHHRLASGQARHTGKGIVFALSRFCHISDAYALKRHLEGSLEDLASQDYQPWFLGALLFIEKRLEVNLSEDILSRGGLWDRWSDVGFLESVDPDHWRKEVVGWVEYAERFD